MALTGTGERQRVVVIVLVVLDISETAMFFSCFFQPKFLVLLYQIGLNQRSSFASQVVKVYATKKSTIILLPVLFRSCEYW